MLKTGMKIAEKTIRAVVPSSLLISIKKIRHRRNVASFKPIIVRKQIGEVGFDFYIGDSTGKRWYGGSGNVESKEMEALRTLLIAPGNTVLECGAHHGYTTLLISSWVGAHGKVFAFEPSETSFGILRKNIEINQRENIVPRRVAIGEGKGVVNMTDSSCASVTSTNVGYPVEVVPLDDFVDLKPDVVKIDVEGFEADVLKGARRLLKSKPKLAIELHTELLPTYGTSVEEVFSLFGFQDYDIWIQWSPNENPVRYDNEKITKRVHLFCIPR